MKKLWNTWFRHPATIGETGLLKIHSTSRPIGQTWRVRSMTFAVNLEKLIDVRTDFVLVKKKFVSKRCTEGHHVFWRSQTGKRICHFVVFLLDQWIIYQPFCRNWSWACHQAGLNTWNPCSNSFPWEVLCVYFKEFRMMQLGRYGWMRFWKCLEDYRYYRHCLHIWFLLAVNRCNAPVSSSRCKDLFCTSYNCRVFFGTDLEPRLLWSTAMASCLEMGHMWGQPWSDRMQFSIRGSHLSWMFFPTGLDKCCSKPRLPPLRPFSNVKCEVVIDFQEESILKSLYQIRGFPTGCTFGFATKPSGPGNRSWSRAWSHMLGAYEEQRKGKVKIQKMPHNFSGDARLFWKHK